eukprot:1748772-Rhodomonas_salina.1
MCERAVQHYGSDVENVPVCDLCYGWGEIGCNRLEVPNRAGRVYSSSSFKKATSGDVSNSDAGA